MQKKLTVSQLNKYIGGVFEDERVLHDVIVCGEVYEYRRSGSKTFITLREGECTLSCVSFCAMTDITEGLSVEAVGTVTFYARTGRVTFVVEEITPVGEGRLLLELLKLREKLRAEGLFDNRLPLPAKISKIAVVTSERGAVLHDILSVIRAKNPFLDVCVYDVRVQGQESAPAIAEALSDINIFDCGADVIIVARGGGSAYDLQPYNTETVARAVAGSRIPVVSAVGHETDYTLCDLCASLRAGTPSIAADIVSEPVTDKIARVKSLAAAMSGALLRKYAAMQSRILYRAMALVSHSELNLRNRENRIRYLITSAYDRLNKTLNTRTEKLAFISAMLDKSSPFKILSQGYAKIGKNGREIASAEELIAGDVISVRMADGKIDAEVL